MAQVRQKVAIALTLLPSAALVSRSYPCRRAGLGDLWDHPPRSDQESGAGHQVHRR
jgi:hypothetical protein